MWLWLHRWWNGLLIYNYTGEKSMSEKEVFELLEDNKVDLSVLQEIEEMIAPACGCGCTGTGMSC